MIWWQQQQRCPSGGDFEEEYPDSGLQPEYFEDRDAVNTISRDVNCLYVWPFIGLIVAVYGDKYPCYGDRVPNLRGTSYKLISAQLIDVYFLMDLAAWARLAIL